MLIEVKTKQKTEMKYPSINQRELLLLVPLLISYIIVDQQTV